MTPVFVASTGTTSLWLTDRINGEVQKYTMVNDGDFSVLVNRLLTRLYGNSAAAERRGGRYGQDNAVRQWEGFVVGRSISIAEVPTISSRS